MSEVIQAIDFKDSQVYSLFQSYLKEKIVLFAGLPGVGKSFLLKELSLMADAAGLRVHLLQWDLSRKAFEKDMWLKRYPEVDGVTHAAIRKAVGFWARGALLNWYEHHQREQAILIGEVPLIGNRLIELAQVQTDEAESLLAEKVLFILPIPSKALREHIEKSRELTTKRPRHEKEAADAPPWVLRALWQELYEAGKFMALGELKDSQDYDPKLYRAVYQEVLKGRRLLRLELTETFTNTSSVYDYAVQTQELLASPAEVAKSFSQAEALGESGDALEQMVKYWYRNAN
ncbi:MAG: hypothetical protein R2880_08180 [Deinococcales bacterium]